MNALSLVPSRALDTKRPGRLGDSAKSESSPPVLLSRVTVAPVSPGKSIFPIDTASAVVHDLKSPLAALTMNLEFALSELPEGAACDEVREALQDCRVAGARLSRMVTNLLDIARGEEGKLVARRVPVNVRTLLQSIAHATLADPRARHISLRTEGYDGEQQLDLADDELFSSDSPLAAIASQVILEITERASLDEITDARGKIAKLRKMGFRIAIDDLGAGYAGLTSFAALEPELVKLDMSLVRDVDQNPTKQKLIGSIATLCRDLGMTVVAEGIETIAERKMVIELGCELLQGYLLAKPGRSFPSFVW